MRRYVLGSRARGFTLIEMLVALALLSLISLAMFQAYRFSQRALLQTTRVDAAVRDVAGAQRFLRRVLENAYPFETASTANGPAERGLMGAAQGLQVTAPALAAEGSAGLYRFELSLSDGEKGELAVRWVQDRNGVPAIQTKKGAQREVILTGVQSLSIDYLQLVELGNGQIEAHWRDSWLDNATLPALVRVRLKFAPGDRRVWPELIVAPRISTDANCVFDVVSQMCRMAS